MNKKLLVVPIVLAIVLGLAVAGAALAQTATPPAGQNAAPNGASPAAPAQGNQGKLFGRNFGFHFGFGLGGGQQNWTVFDTVAKTLKLTPTQLFEQLHSGKSLSDIATAQGVDISAVQTAVQSVRTQALKDQINQAVKDGRITQDQANWLLQGIDKGYMNRGFGFFKGAPMGRFGGRGMPGNNRGSQAAPKAAPQTSPTPGI